MPYAHICKEVNPSNFCSFSLSFSNDFYEGAYMTSIRNNYTYRRSLLPSILLFFCKILIQRHIFSPLLQLYYPANRPKIYIFIASMLVDPRPFTYQYRKPRIFNPTYQSRNLYESLYHRYQQEGNDYFSPKVPMRYESNERIQRYGNQPEQKDLGRNMSDLKGRRGNTNDVQSGASTDRNPERAPAGYILPSIGKAADRNRAQSNLGANMQQPQNNQQNPIQRRKGFERFRIYQRQQKPFNIISCYPKEDDSNKLRSFPKLTLEDRLIQRGSYHNFREQKF